MKNLSWKWKENDDDRELIRKSAACVTQSHKAGNNSLSWSCFSGFWLITSSFPIKLPNSYHFNREVKAVLLIITLISDQSISPFYFAISFASNGPPTRKKWGIWTANALARCQKKTREDKAGSMTQLERSFWMGWAREEMAWLERWIYFWTRKQPSSIGRVDCESQHDTVTQLLTVSIGFMVKNTE